MTFRIDSPTHDVHPPLNPKAVLLSAIMTIVAGAVLAQQIWGGQPTSQTASQTPSQTVQSLPHTPVPMSPDFAAQPIRRCLNVANDLESPPDEDWGYSIRAEDFARIRRAGFDTVRLPVKWSAYTGPGPNYRIDPTFLRRVDGHVTDAMDRGLQVILNVHHFDEFNVRPDAEEARLIAIWDQLAAYFRGRNEGLIFELLNEPHFENVDNFGDQDYSVPIGIARMNRINRVLSQRIRRTHPNRWIILGSSQWGTPWPLFEGVNGVTFASDPDPRTIATFHYYEPIPFTHQDLEFTDHPPFPRQWGTANDRAEINAVFQSVADFRAGAGRGMPVLLGEFGTATSLPTDQRIAWTQHMREAAEGHAFGWCAFDFASPTFGMFDTGFNQWNTDILQSLIPPR